MDNEKSPSADEVAHDRQGSGARRATDWTDDALQCPVCGYLDFDAGELDEKRHEGKTTCINCHASFAWQRMIRIQYRGRLLSETDVVVHVPGLENMPDDCVDALGQMISAGVDAAKAGKLPNT